MFESLPSFPPDPIFGLNEQFRKDSREHKINLTVGTFQDESGETAILESVKRAERLILDSEKSKSYLQMSGLEDFNQLTGALLLGEHSPAVEEGRYCTLQTPGGTGALRIAAEFLASQRSDSKIWIGTPTWDNHLNIFRQAGVEIASYAYLKPCKTQLDFESLVSTLSDAEPGDAVLLHACCHNPSGVDPQVDQWEVVFGMLRERQLLPIFDCAYQGFKSSIDDDAFPLRRLAQLGVEFLVCSSNSKNFGLYGERVGAVSAVCQSARDAHTISSCLQSIIRAIYSNPPKHGALIVATILSDESLRKLWVENVSMMRERIHSMRHRFAEAMAAKLAGQQFDFIGDQHGMFSFTGLAPEQVDTLREDFAIYMLRSGRINIAGLNSGNLQRTCDSIAQVAGQMASH